MSDDDPLLRRHFEALRARDAERAPDFGHTLPRARARAAPGRRPRRWPLRLAAPVAAVLLAALLWRELAPSGPATPEWAPVALELADLGRWRVPSDVLLATPGRELLGAPPRIESGPASGPLPARPGPGGARLRLPSPDLEVPA